MRQFLTLLGREVSHYFHQPLAYIVIFCFLLITGFNFHAGVAALNKEAGSTTIVEAFFNTVFFWFPFVLIFPLITMRLFAEEFKMGTIEALLTAPVTDLQVILAKYVGAVIFYIVLWAPSLLYFVIFQSLTRVNAAGAAGSYVGAYTMLLLIGMFYLSIGCLASSLTSNQIVAAVISFAVVLLMFFAGLISFLVPSVSPVLRELVYYLSAIEHMMDFSRGIFDTRPVVFYLTMTFLMLFLTHQVFQYRRWKA